MFRHQRYITSGLPDVGTHTYLRLVYIDLLYFLVFDKIKSYLEHRLPFIVEEGSENLSNVNPSVTRLPRLDYQYVLGITT